MLVFFYRLFALTSLIFVFTSSLSAKTLHVLLAADTLSELQVATSKDIQNIKMELEEIARATSSLIVVNILQGIFLTKEKFYEWAQYTNVASDDIIFFYYTGHGLRTHNNHTIWPSLFLPPKKEILDFCEIIHIISSKRASFNVVLADCCNNFVKPASSPAFFLQEPYYAKSAQSENVLKNYQKLFLQTKGTIVASGATPGKKSFCTKRGSIFTNAFISSLKSELEEHSPRWKRLLKKSRSLCLHLQKPQYHLNIHGE